MKAGSFIIQSSVLLVGLIIVFASLYSANDTSYSLGDTASRRHFYISAEILPDHLLYPVIMMIDRTALASAKTPAERIRIQVNYAHRRLNSARTLSAQHKPGMALSTLTKSQKYLNQAAQDAIAHGTPQDRALVIRAIANHEQLINTITDTQLLHNQDVVHLREEANALKNQLQSMP